MNVNELKEIPTKAELLEIRDRLNLSDRQRTVFYLKYGRRWRHIDIAEEVGVCQDTISADVNEIAKKLAAIKREDIDNQNGG